METYRYRRRRRRRHDRNCIRAKLWKAKPLRQRGRWQMVKDKQGYVIGIAFIDGAGVKHIHKYRYDK